MISVRPSAPAASAAASGRGDVVAGMRRLLGEVGVVVIEVADQGPVGERRPVRRGEVSWCPSRVRPARAERLEAIRRAITHGSAFQAPSAQPIESITRRLTSWTTAAASLQSASSTA